MDRTTTQKPDSRNVALVHGSSNTPGAAAVSRDRLAVLSLTGTSAAVSSSREDMSQSENRVPSLNPQLSTLSAAGVSSVRASSLMHLLLSYRKRSPSVGWGAVSVA